MVAEPVDDVFLAGPVSAGHFQRRPFGVVGNPIQVGSPVEQQLCCPPLSGGASVPESLRQRIDFGAGIATEQFFKAIEHAEG